VAWKVKERQRYALIEQDSENSRKCRGTFFIAPRHVKHHSTKEFVEFSYVTTPNFASQKDCRVFAQNSHVAIEVYDYYAKLFDPDYETVSVYDERFVVQYLFKTKPQEEWRDVDAYNPTIQVIPLENGGEIKRIFDTDYGTQTLEISHVIKTGRLLKHNIVFTNKTPEQKTFRVVMKLAGITNSKVRHNAGQLEVTEETSIGTKPFFLIGEDNQHLKLTEYLWSLGIANEETEEWSATTLKDIIFDVHAQGCKADIIIGNYTLAQNEWLEIDPDTSTWQVSASSDDATVSDDDGDGTPDSMRALDYTYAKIGKYTDYYGNGLRFLSVGIGQGATIESAYLKATSRSTRTLTNAVKSRIEGEDTDDAATFSDITNYLARSRTTANVNWNPTGTWASGVEWSSPDIKTIIQEIVNRGGWSSGNAIVLFWEDRDCLSTDSYYIHHYDSSSNDSCRLTVTWTTGVTAYTKTWQTDVLFKKLGITKTEIVDIAFKKPDITKTFGLDSAFVKTTQIQRQVNTLLKKLGILEQFGVDVGFLKRDIVRSFAINTRFGAVVTYTMQKQIDALFKKLGIQKTFAIDAYIGAVTTQTYTKTLSIDVIFRYKVKLPSILGITLDGQLVIPLKKEAWVES
jgi:hypothetical protein